MNELMETILLRLFEFNSFVSPQEKALHPNVESTSLHTPGYSRSFLRSYDVCIVYGTLSLCLKIEASESGS